jgi:16S rRNA (cytosine1402-N4)-methyltransferase
MRMDSRLPLTAADLIARRTEEELSGMFQSLGDETDHARIARKIVAKRAEEPITRSGELVSLVFEAKRITLEEWKARLEAEPGALHPAARTFQALRMMVNDEIGQLDHLLRTLPFALRPGGRVAIISFHHGEDRRVRAAFESGLAEGIWSSISPGPIRPTAPERRDNPRSASALLRWAKRAAGDQV